MLEYLWKDYRLTPVRTTLILLFVAAYGVKNKLNVPADILELNAPSGCTLNTKLKSV
jgi:hypothetical protein